LLLPGTSGVDLLDRLRAQGRSVPAIVVSALGAHDGLAERAREFGAVTIVSKPFDRRQLVSSVAEATRAIQKP
jgi:FixJ family two-component response regulator